MLLPLAAALMAFAASQAGGTIEPNLTPDAEQETTRTEISTRYPEAARQGSYEIDGAGQRGIPFVPSIGDSDSLPLRPALDFAAVSLVRMETLKGTDSGTFWGTVVVVAPGIAFHMQSPAVRLEAGYGARLSIPVHSIGEALAVLHLAYGRMVWRIDPLWTALLSVSGTFGQYSQLEPVATPGGPGSPPPALNPVRSFSTYPYLALAGFIRVSRQLSSRSRLQASGGYLDVGGTQLEGTAAQPQTAGPFADVAFEWDASKHATLTTTAAYQNSRLGGDFSIQLGIFTETWKQQWTPDLETTASAGGALSSSDSITFLSVGHFLPVASIGASYHTDVRRTVRLGVDLALAPYVDSDLRVAYQRLTARLAFDWRPQPSLFVGLYVAGALAPYLVGAPDTYGMAGASIGWAPGGIFTFSLGGVSRSQSQGRTGTAGGWFQWSAYVSVSVRDRVAL